MALTLAGHLGLIEDEHAAALAAPLSARQAMLVAVLLDRFADRVFLAFRRSAPERVFRAEDMPAYRTRLRQASPALATIFGLCAIPAEGLRLAVVPVEVPIADYPRLSVEDFMVSLYNGNTVQRVVIVAADGSQRLAHELLGEAVGWWRRALAG